MSEMDASELEDIDLNETDVSASTNGQGGGPLLETPDSNEEPMPRLLSGSNDGSDDGTDPEMPDGSDDDPRGKGQGDAPAPLIFRLSKYFFWRSSTPSNFPNL